MAHEFAFGGEIAWRPSPEHLRDSRIARFMARHNVPSYDALLRRSTEDLTWFWEAVFEDLGMEFYEPYRQLADTSRGIAWTRWCVGGRLNIVHNCLDKWMGTPTEQKAALRWEGEEGPTRVITYGELHADVNRCANALPISLYWPGIFLPAACATWPGTEPSHHWHPRYSSG